MKKVGKKELATNQLARLTKEEQKDPLSVLANFFDNYHLSDVREELWNWLTAGVTNDRTYENAKDRSNLIFLYQNVESLTEAAYLLLQDRRRAARKGAGR